MTSGTAKPLLTGSPSGAGQRRLQEIFRSVCASFEVELKQFNGESISRPFAGDVSCDGSAFANL
jgi:hypothetical protein